MNRTAKILIILLLVLFSVCWITPYLIHTQHIRTALVERISSSVKAETTVEKIRWRWLPLPHVTLYDSHIHNDDFDLNIPKTRIYPNWLALFNQKVTVGRIYLQEPEFSAHPSFFSATGTSSFILPQANLVIHDGSLKADLPDFKGVKYQTIHFENTNMNLRNSGDHATFTLQSNSSFSDSLKISGKYLFGSKEFSTKSIIKKFQLDNILTHGNSWISPLPSDVDMEFDRIGQGTEELRILFSGNIPDFSVQRLEDKAEFHFDTADFVFEKNSDSLKLNLINLQLANPGLQLSGEIEEYYTADLEEPSYHLDLKSRNINLNEVRTKLLALLGDTSITSTICDIVRGGRATSASYTFNAPLSGFSHIESMAIKVDVASADIHVPAVNLDLKQASGPIQIIDGDLSGKGLSTWLGNSFGSNGSFLLGLGSHKWAFNLDVDIDADVSELPGTLHDLIDADVFKKEIVQFAGAGRTKAHLLIGDDLRDFSVLVNINNTTDAGIYYDRIPWPIKLEKGSIYVIDSKAVWKNISAVVGPHTIQEVSGETSWEDDAVPTEIKSLSASINTDSLHQELLKYPQLADIINSHLQSATGVLDIKQGVVKGPFFDPRNWDYQFNTEFRDVVFSTPHLPGPVQLTTGSALIQPGAIQLEEMDTTFLNSPLSLTTVLNQQQNKNWQGSLTVNGPLTIAQTNWLRAKRWLPEQLLPTTPSNLDNFDLTWGEHTHTAKGTVSNTTLSGTPARADFAFHSDTAGLQNLVIELENENERGQLSILKPSTPSLPAKISWKGLVSQQTLSAIFDKQHTYSGQLSGDFMITLPVGNTPLNIDGQVSVNNLQRGWGEQLRQISIQSLNLTGKGNELFVNNMDIEYQNETAFISGKLLFTPSNVHLDLQQKATTLSEQKLSDFINDLSSFFGKFDVITESDNNEKPKTVSILSGLIHLQADKFLLDAASNEEKDDVYVIEPLQATVDLSNPQATTLNISDSLICSLPLEGTLQWTDTYTQKDFNLALPEEQTLFFQKFLPCVGVKKKFIEGAFNVNGTITDTDGDLTAGSFTLTSTNGTLWRLVFLSKIFQLINFTDLYEGLFSKGFPYTVLDLNAHIKNNLLIFDKAVIEGQGLNLMIQGSVNLKNSEANLIVFIIPFKSIDAIIKNIPLVGKFINRLVGGKKGHIITIPVEVSGNIKDPVVTLMSPKAVGSSAIDFILDTITFPLDVLPDFSYEKKEVEVWIPEEKSDETPSASEKNERSEK